MHDVFDVLRRFAPTEVSVTLLGETGTGKDFLAHALHDHSSRADGPFVEGKEVVSGYTEIEVADLDKALKMVSTWPGCPLVEIRPLEA